jgi:hypothetical protein
VRSRNVYLFQIAGFLYIPVFSGQIMKEAAFVKNNKQKWLRYEEKLKHQRDKNGDRAKRRKKAALNVFGLKSCPKPWRPCRKHC